MSLDAMQRMMNSFKQFEKKIDKLQDEVKYQGQTLLDLRVMVMNLSAGNINYPDTKPDESKVPPKVTAAIQYEEKVYPQGIDRLIRQSGVKSLPSKLKAKNSQNQKPRRLSSGESPFQAQLHKKESSKIHMQRHRKAEVIRKSSLIKGHKKGASKKQLDALIE